MIRITIELISALHVSRDRVLGIMEITNDRTALTEDKKRSLNRGNYSVRLFKKGAAVVQYQRRTTGIIHKTTQILNWPRRSYTVWRLVQKALNQLYP
jgi:hypothetical protein